jgi:hypothetical protein
MEVMASTMETEMAKATPGVYIPSPSTGGLYEPRYTSRF